MEHDRYPKNWFAISTEVKTAADWHCQYCGKPCRKPGESLEELADRLSDDWYAKLCGEVWDEETGEHAEVPLYPQRFCLTAAHLDQNPSNNDPANLRALCAPCHLRHDRPHITANAYAKRERQGQIPLPLPLNDHDPKNRL
jgi:hypothetical protein